MEITREIQKLFIQKGLTLATAESCTGGKIGSLLVENLDASLYFLGGVIVYSNHLKQVFLGISEEVLKTHGAVSPQVAQAMAEGVLEKVGSDYSLAVTGIAGPSGGSSEKPVGLVFLAVGCKGKKTKVWKKQFSGDRLSVLDQTAQEGLKGLWDECSQTVR